MCSWLLDTAKCQIGCKIRQIKAKPITEIKPEAGRNIFTQLFCLIIFISKGKINTCTQTQTDRQTDTHSERKNEGT